MKKKIIALSLCAVILIGILVVAISYISFKNSPPVTATIVINQGDSVFKVASKLEKAGIIWSSPFFILRMTISGDKNKIQYGTYELSSKYSYEKIVQVISSGKARDDVAKITVPEGYSVQQIAKLIDESPIKVTADEFLFALEDRYNYKFINDIPSSTDRDYKLQGFLFPSTYEFYLDTTAHDVVNTMLAEFERQYEMAGTNNSGMSFYDVMKVASIIEREALLDDELSIIAGVVHNRLDIDMPLQIDATVVYAVTEGMYNINSVTYKDLEINSFYNTYKNKGLTPGPICNPGAEAIKAALNPQHHEYLYYHTDETKGDGSHIFTKTYQEHQNTMQ